MESKKYNKLMNIIKISRLTDAENKLVITSGGGTNYRADRLKDVCCPAQGNSANIL